MGWGGEVGRGVSHYYSARAAPSRVWAAGGGAARTRRRSTRSPRSGERLTTRPSRLTERVGVGDGRRGGGGCLTIILLERLPLVDGRQAGGRQGHGVARLALLAQASGFQGGHPLLGQVRGLYPTITRGLTGAGGLERGEAPGGLVGVQGVQGGGGGDGGDDGGTLHLHQFRL